MRSVSRRPSEMNIFTSFNFNRKKKLSYAKWWTLNFFIIFGMEMKLCGIFLLNFHCINQMLVVCVWYNCVYFVVVFKVFHLDGLICLLVRLKKCPLESIKATTATQRGKIIILLNDVKWIGQVLFYRTRTRTMNKITINREIYFCSLLFGINKIGTCCH